VDDRTARIEFALGASYDQMKKPKEAARRIGVRWTSSRTIPDAQHALANALLADDQLDEALKVFQALVAADPTDGSRRFTSRRFSAGRGITTMRWRRWRRPRRRCRIR
jgi:hypothetical protein